MISISYNNFNFLVKYIPRKSLIHSYYNLSEYITFYNFPNYIKFSNKLMMYFYKQ